MKLCTVVGARPQFIKAASLSAELRRHHAEVLIHTGQHYDYEMSKVFFEELAIPVPDYNLETGSGSHGVQTGAMLAGVEKVLLDERPDAVVVIGDTNSTLAGALAAAKLDLPVAHVEAGLRSFRRSMPEEVNRVLTDHLSRWLFCPTPASVRNLEREGICRGVHHIGDVLDDSLAHALPIARKTPGIRGRMELPGLYAYVTLHRAENTDDPGRLRAFTAAIEALGMRAVFPVHPRARSALTAAGLWDGLAASKSVRVIDPVSYLDSLRLLDGAALVVTDSGGLQREAAALGVPCVVAREETEWVEALEGGRTVLGGAAFGNLSRIANELLCRTHGTPRPAVADRAGATRRVREILEAGF